MPRPACRQRTTLVTLSRRASSEVVPVLDRRRPFPEVAGSRDECCCRLDSRSPPRPPLSAERPDGRHREEMATKTTKRHEIPSVPSFAYSLLASFRVSCGHPEQADRPLSQSLSPRGKRGRSWRIRSAILFGIWCRRTGRLRGRWWLPSSRRSSPGFCRRGCRRRLPGRSR